MKNKRTTRKNIGRAHQNIGKTGKHLQIRDRSGDFALTKRMRWPECECTGIANLNPHRLLIPNPSGYNIGPPQIALKLLANVNPKPHALPASFLPFMHNALPGNPWRT